MPGERMDADGRVVLAEIRGDIKRIFDRHDRYAEDMARADRAHAEFQRVTNDRLQSQSMRITVLEAARTKADGEREGSERTVKKAYAVWAALTTGGVVALIAALARAFHV